MQTRNGCSWRSCQTFGPGRLRWLSVLCAAQNASAGARQGSTHERICISAYPRCFSCNSCMILSICARRSCCFSPTVLILLRERPTCAGSPHSDRVVRVAPPCSHTAGPIRKVSGKNDNKLATRSMGGPRGKCLTQCCPCHFTPGGMPRRVRPRLPTTCQAVSGPVLCI